MLRRLITHRCASVKNLPYTRYDTAAHLSRIIGEIIKKLKYAEARDDCREMIGALSVIHLKGNNSAAVVGLFVKPLFEAMRQRNKVVQSGAAICMARMVESAPTPPITSFQKLCPIISKLLSNPSFLAKASLLPLVSTLSQVGAIAPQSLESLLESIHDCLTSTDWVTRKAAADTLTALALHSSSLIKDKTDFTIALLENCWFDKFQIVRQSVTKALQSWKNISRKCVDGESKNEVKRSHLADLMEKEASDGSTLSPTSSTEEQGAPPDKEAFVMLKNEAPAIIDKEFSQRLRFVEVVFPRKCKTNDEEEGWLARRQSVEIVFPRRRKNNDEESRLNAMRSADPFDDDNSKFHNLESKAPGNHAAAVYHSVAFSEAEGRRTSTIWGNAIRALRLHGVNSAYVEVFGAGDQRLILILMSHTGPVFEHLSAEVRNKVLRFISQLLLVPKFYRICVVWLQQLLEVLVRGHRSRFAVSMDLRTEILYKLQQSCSRMEESELLVVPTLVVQLADVWGVEIQINLSE